MYLVIVSYNKDAVYGLEIVDLKDFSVANYRSTHGMAPWQILNAMKGRIILGYGLVEMILRLNFPLDSFEAVIDFKRTKYPDAVFVGNILSIPMM